MALTSSITCSLNLSPPPNSASNPSRNTTTQVTWLRNEQKWRKQCVLSMASMIIAMDMGASLMGHHENLAMAKDMQIAIESEEKPKGTRWSDKRMCPPWRLNSLETIVPENLPRPSARRRWESIGSSTNAPAVKVIVRRSSNCFSM